MFCSKILKSAILSHASSAERSEPTVWSEGRFPLQTFWPFQLLNVRVTFHWGGRSIDFWWSSQSKTRLANHQGITPNHLKNWFSGEKSTEFFLKEQPSATPSAAPSGQCYWGSTQVAPKPGSKLMSTTRIQQSVREIIREMPNAMRNLICNIKTHLGFLFVESCHLFENRERMCWSGLSPTK